MSEQRIRKPVTDLSEADLAETPVWEFALDEEGEKGQNETTVRPWFRAGPIDPTEGMFVVRARFVLADGTAMTGYLTPSSASQRGLGTVQPTIITYEGQVSFWCGMATPSAEYLQRSYDRLGRNAPSEVFPLHFWSNVPLVGEEVRGELAGFLVLEDLRTGRTRAVR